MSKFKIVNILDKLFIACAIFLIAFAWINFYIRNLWTTFFIALALSISICFIINFFSEKKEAKVINKKTTEEKINNSFFNFKLMTREEKFKVLSNVFKDYELKIRLGNLFAKLGEKNCQIILATHIDILNQNLLINLLDEHAKNADKYIILCNEDATTNKNIYKDREIEIINKLKLYELFEANNCVPNGENINSKINKPSFRELFSLMFARKKAKGYFFCGLILIFSSIILPYHRYYLIIGSMLLSFSVVCKLKKNSNA